MGWQVTIITEKWDFWVITHSSMKISGKSKTSQENKCNSMNYYEKNGKQNRKFHYALCLLKCLLYAHQIIVYNSSWQKNYSRTKKDQDVYGEKTKKQKSGRSVCPGYSSPGTNCLHTQRTGTVQILSKGLSNTEVLWLYAPSKKMQLMKTKSENDLDDNQKLNFASLTWEWAVLYRPLLKSVKLHLNLSWHQL